MLRGKDVNDLINVHKRQHHPGIANLLSWSRISARLTWRVYETASFSCGKKDRICCLQLFWERLSGKVHATILKSIVGGFEFSFFQRNLKELARKAMDMCLRVLKKSNKSRTDSYSRQEQCIDHIPYYLSGLSLHIFSPNLSRNSCI